MIIRKHSAVISTLLFSVTTSGGILLMTPLIIQNYGKSLYILWSVSTSICALLFIFDFGITSVASQKFLSHFKKTGTFTIQSWKLFLRFHSKILISVALLLLTIFILQTHFEKNLSMSLNYLTIFLITIVSTLITILCHQQIIKFQIGDNYQTSLTFITLIKLFETLLTLLLLILAINFVTICLSILAVRSFQFFLLRRYSRLSFEIGASFELNQKDPSFSLRYFMGPILYSSSSVLSIHATFLIQSVFMNPNQTVTVLITRMIASPIRIVADSLAIGNFDKLIRRSIVITTSKSTSKPTSLIYDHLVLFVVTTPYVVIANFLGQPLIDFLSSGQLEVNFLLLNLFCLATLLDGMIVIFMQYKISGGMHYGIGFTYFVTTILGFAMLLVLIQYIDLYAGVISIIICDLLFVSIRVLTQEAKNEN